MLTIVTPAVTRGLLDAVALRTAAGLASDDQSRDTELAALGLTVADTISDWCNVAGDGLTPATLRMESVSEIFRITDGRHPCRRSGGLEGPAPLILSRRFVSAVTIVENGVTLVLDTDFEVDAGSGLVYRLLDDCRTSWWPYLITASYGAGFTTVPTPLAAAASEMIARQTGAIRDPLVRSERIEVAGIETIERQFWADASDSVDITSDMAEKLAVYRSAVVG